MSTEARLIAYELLKTGALVAFRILEEKVLQAPDEAEFGLRLQLKFVADEEQDERDDDEAAEDTAEWGSFGFLFVLGALSFEEAKPREASALDYQEKDEFKLADFIEGLRFLRGELHFDGIAVTDWRDIEYLHDRHHIAATQKDAVMIAVNAGIDMSMVPSVLDGDCETRTRGCDFLFQT